MQPVLVDGTQFELHRRIEYLDNLFGALHRVPPRVELQPELVLSASHIQIVSKVSGALRGGLKRPIRTENRLEKLP